MRTGRATLVASDCRLLNEDTFEPKPNYWGALFWRRLMGTKVLEPGVTNGPGLHVMRNACGRAWQRGNARVPMMRGQATAIGQLTFAPARITVLEVSSAQNQAYRSRKNAAKPHTRDSSRLSISETKLGALSFIAFRACRQRLPAGSLVAPPCSVPRARPRA